MKLVSVIIPTHRGVNCICHAIESIYKQTYDNIEIIVVDDNGLGTENQIATQKVLEKYIENPNFKYIAHEINKNGAAARNTGFNYSKGEYISLLDDDDEYLPNKIACEVDALDKCGASYGMAYCSCMRILNNKSKTRIAKKSGNLLFELLTHKVVIGSNSLLVRRYVYQAVGMFDESFKRHQDFEFTTKVAAKYKIIAVKEIGFIYHCGESRNSPKSNELAQEYRRHYINQMLPYIDTFNQYHKHYILIINAIEVINKKIKKKGIFALYQAVKKYLSPWVDKPRIDAFLVIFIKKIYDGIKKAI